MNKAPSRTSLSNVQSETHKLRWQNTNVLPSQSMRCLLSQAIVEFPNSRHMYALHTYFLLMMLVFSYKVRLRFHFIHWLAHWLRCGALCCFCCIWHTDVFTAIIIISMIHILKCHCNEISHFFFPLFFTQNNLPSCTMSFRPERKN